MSVDPFVLGADDDPSALLDGHIQLTIVDGRVAFRQVDQDAR